MSKEEIINLLGGKCKSCESKKNLHIHHKLPYWLWRNVGETDKGILSIKFIQNYEVLCHECHMERHDFLNKNLVKGFRWHYSFKIRWKRPDRLNIISYPIYVNDKTWTIATLGGKWVWKD